MKYITWTTFANQNVSLDNITHQHLSNCFWYTTIILNAEKDDKYLQILKETAKKRFNGQLLSYRPHVEFTAEIDRLRELGLLSKLNDRTEIIIYNGDVVGEITQF